MDIQNKRDNNSMGNRYFETIDERDFYKYSIDKYISERRENKFNAYLKRIESHLMQQQQHLQRLQVTDPEIKQ